MMNEYTKHCIRDILLYSWLFLFLCYLVTALFSHFQSSVKLGINFRTQYFKICLGYSGVSFSTKAVLYIIVTREQIAGIINSRTALPFIYVSVSLFFCYCFPFVSNISKFIHY